MLDSRVLHYHEERDEPSVCDRGFEIDNDETDRLPNLAPSPYGLLPALLSPESLRLKSDLMVLALLLRPPGITNGEVKTKFDVEDDPLIRLGRSADIEERRDVGRS